MYTYYTTNLKWSGSSGGDDESTRSSGVHGAAVLDHSQNVTDFGRSISFSSWPDYCVLPKPVQVLLTDTYGAWVLLVYFDVDSQTLLGVGVSHCEWQVSRLWQLLFIRVSDLSPYDGTQKETAQETSKSFGPGAFYFILFYSFILFIVEPNVFLRHHHTTRNTKKRRPENVVGVFILSYSP